MRSGFEKPGTIKPTAIERLVVRQTDGAKPGWVPESFGALSREEKAQYFYDLVITARQARVTGDAPGAEAMLSRMKSIIEKDPTAVKYFSEAFTLAREEQKIVERSPFFQKIVQSASEIKALSAEYAGLKQRVFTGEITGVASRKDAEERIKELSQKIVVKQRERTEMAALDMEMDVDVVQKDGTTAKEKRIPERIKENTDIAAFESYTTFKRYHKEAADGFAWLPSRVEINQKIFAALKNGRFPLLIGEPGTGKSEQADAVARDLTGEACVKVACTSSTGEHDLILEKEVEEGTSYHEYGGVTQAFTGYEKSTDSNPAYAHGRIVRLDEFLKINFDKSFGLIKEIGQKKVGEPMHRKVNHPVLPGSSIIATSNPSGARHHLEDMLPALEREFAEIKVDYLPMSHENPELYEFMVATLMDKKGYIALPKGEIAPAYTEKEMIGERKTADGRKILQEQEIVSDAANDKHSALYRLSFAVKALQDSYVAHNPDERPNYADRLLRIENGKISDNGEELTLESSTLTLKEIASWMRGFEHRFEETNPAMHTKTFSEWLAYKTNVFISQSPEQDREKLTAIFDHFGILSPELKVYDKKPMTHLEIGYLSPRVPRPFIMEEKIRPDLSRDAKPGEHNLSDRHLETIAYVTEDGEQEHLSPRDTEYEAFDGGAAALVPEQAVRIFDDHSDAAITVFYRGMTADGKLAFSRESVSNELVILFEKALFERKAKEGTAKDFEKEIENDFEWYQEDIRDMCAEENVTV